MRRSKYLTSRVLECLIAGLSLGGALALGSQHASAQAPATERQVHNIEGFNIKQEPKAQDWREFLRAPEGQRQKLWTYHVRKGHKLGDWAWGWRMGWVRSCAASTTAFCTDIFNAALFDDALVVRAEAATKLGRRFEGTKNKDVVSLLVRAYENPRNLRNKKPLFIQQRILFALMQVGGAEAFTEAARLAASHELSQAYWKSLAAKG